MALHEPPHDEQQTQDPEERLADEPPDDDQEEQPHRVHLPQHRAHLAQGMAHLAGVAVEARGETSVRHPPHPLAGSPSVVPGAGSLPPACTPTGAGPGGTPPRAPRWGSRGFPGRYSTPTARSWPGSGG